MVDSLASATQGTDTAKDQTPGLIEAERGHDIGRIPCPLALRQDAVTQMGRQGLGGQIEIGQFDHLGGQRLPGRVRGGVGIGGHHDLVRRNTA